MRRLNAVNFIVSVLRLWNIVDRHVGVLIALIALIMRRIDKRVLSLSRREIRMPSLIRKFNRKSNKGRREWWLIREEQDQYINKIKDVSAKIVYARKNTVNVSVLEYIVLKCAIALIVRTLKSIVNDLFNFTIYINEYIFN